MAAGSPMMGLTGTVRSYNGVKGFGFIVPSEGGDEGQQDVMFNKNDLPEDAKEIRGQVIEGRQVLYNAEVKPDGRHKATSVQLLYAEGAQVTGAIKSYSHRSGYGFLTSSSLSEDVYFSGKELQMAQDSNPTGQLVVFEVITGPNGRLKAQKVQFQSKKVADQFRSQSQAPPEMPQMPQPAVDAAAAAAKHLLTSMGFFGGAPGPLPQLTQQLPLMNRPAQAERAERSRPPPAAEAGPPPREAVDVLLIACGAAGTLPGVVKYFNKDSGHGYIQIPGIPIDVKFTRNEARSVSKGAVVQFAFHEDQDGRLVATQVVPTGQRNMSAVSHDSRDRESQPSSRPAPLPLALPTPPAVPLHVERALAGASRNSGSAKRPLFDSRRGEQQREHRAPKAQRIEAAPVSTVPTGEYRAGVVKSYNFQKGWGLIQSPDIEEDVFFLKSHLPIDVRETSIAGSSVEYELVNTSEGKLRAQDITIV